MTITGCISQQFSEGSQSSPHFREGVFHNEAGPSLPEKQTFVRVLWRFLFEKPSDTRPLRLVPLAAMDKQRLITENRQGVAVYRLGHSSLLLDLSGEYWLVDPVFSERASPLSWLGPKRFHPTPITLDQLPRIQGVIISHDHYDHLDRDTIQQLKGRVAHFVTPLGVGGHLRSWGVAPDHIHELDWWQSQSFGQVSLTATPAQHFSGRGITDRNRTLWSSWVIRAGNRSIFFSGDSGYFAGFKQIGDRYGPFDLTVIENGAYDRHWPQVHMQPEETLQAHLDLRGRALMPVHNGTFDLALHAWFEPLERLASLAERQQVQLVTPLMGERVVLGEVRQYHAWWRDGGDREVIAALTANSESNAEHLELVQF